MKNNKRKIKNSRSGMILVIAVVIVLILALIGIGLLQLGRNARLQGEKDVLQISARSAADAGIEHAVRYMIDGWNTAPVKSDWLAGWRDSTEWTDPPPETRKGRPTVGPVSLDGTFGAATFTYDIYRGTKSTGYQIISTGKAAGVTRKVHAAVVLRSVFFGIGAKRDIYIYPGMELGTVPDGDTFIMQTNSTEDGAITLKPNLVIPGDVVIGPGGDPDTAISLPPKDGSVIIEGDAKAAEDYIDFPSIYPPDPPLPVDSWTVPDEVNEPTVAYIYADIQLNGGLTLGSGSGIDTLYIEGSPAVNEGKVKVYVVGDTYLATHTKLIVTENSSLVLYLGGNMEVKGGENGAIIIYDDGIFTTDTEKIDAAKRISIKGTVAADGTPLCTEILFFPKGDFYGTIYAPDADPLILKPGNNFYGAIVGADNIDLQPGGTFMFIPSLVDINDVEVLYMGIKHGSWWEE